MRWDLAHGKGKFSSDTMQKVDMTIHVAEERVSWCSWAVQRRTTHKEKFPH